MVTESFLCPTKIIFAGEHFVVHGAQALAMPVQPFNKVTIKESDELVFKTPWAVLRGADCIRQNFFLSPVINWLNQNNLKTNYELSYEVNGFKGMGNSASAAALTAKSLLFVNGIDNDLLVKELALECENLAHGGRAFYELHAIGINVPTLFYCDAANSTIVMEKIRGQTLDTLQKNMHNNIAKKAYEQAARLLAKIHNHSFWHGDYNPKNLILQEKTNNIFLIDFGLSKSNSRNEEMAYDILTMVKSTFDTQLARCFLKEYKKHNPKVFAAYSKIAALGRYK